MTSKLRLVGLLLSPSPLSLVITFGIVILLSVSTLIKYGLNTTSLYDLVLGKGSSPDLINNTHIAFSTFYQNIFGNPTLNRILFFLFWMLIGLIVYLFLNVLGHGIGQADETVHEMNYVHANKTKSLEHYIKRIGIHCGVVVVLLLYSVLFLKAISPFGLLNVQISAAGLPQLSAFGYGVLGILVLSVGLYVYVILLRLFFLRIRVFGSDHEF